MSILQNQRKKLALVIGIDHYPKLLARDQLTGCVNDAELMAKILQENFGFPEADISILRNEQATRAGILAAMDQLVDCAAPDDIVVMHYAGHGSQMQDREDDEPDGWDETIVPYDTGRNKDENRDITDDEIYLRLLRLNKKTPFVTLIFDCCHSGTITRDPFGAKSRWVERDERPVEKLPPSPIPAETARGTRRDLGPSGWFPVSDRYVLIAGCQNEESSYEITDDNGVNHGVLTYYLSEELRKAKSGTTYRDVFERASAMVTAKRPHQHPQMEGARDRELFDVHDIEPMHFVVVKENKNDQVVLSAGVAHGMTAGSRWAIYAQATKQVTAKTPRLGLVEITAVRAVISEAKILDGAKSIAAGSRAVEEAHHYGQMQLFVKIQESNEYRKAVKKLSKLIEASPMLCLAQGGEAAACVYIVSPRAKVKVGDPVPQLGEIREATWAVVGQDGKLMMPAHAVNEAEAEEIILSNLEKKFRFEQTLKLENANVSDALQGKVDLTLKRQKTGGVWEIARPENENGYIIFTEGERLAMQVVNRHHASIYVSVFDFGVAGAVTQLFPPAGANEKVEPKQTLEIGVREGQELEFFLPENFPFTNDFDGDKPTTGVETLKVFATTQEADFSRLAHEGYRGGPGGDSSNGDDSPLGQLLKLTLTGEGTRDVRINHIPDNEEWTTFSRTFILKRKT